MVKEAIRKMEMVADMVRSRPMSIDESFSIV